MPKGTAGALPQEWVPSLGRTCVGVTTRGAAANQPAGAALPSLCPDTITSAAEHFWYATQLDPTASIPHRAISARSEWIAARCISGPRTRRLGDRIPPKRSRIPPNVVPPIRKAWRSRLPDDSPSRNLNFLPANALNGHDAEISRRVVRVRLG